MLRLPSNGGHRAAIFFAVTVATAFAFTWWALWYPWGAVPATPLYLYTTGMRGCFALAFPHDVLCTLVSDQFLNGQFRPSQTWFYAMFIDPWSFEVRGALYQVLLVANWLVCGALCFVWLQIFQVPVLQRWIASVLIMFASSIVWYSAGSANIDPLALTMALGLALLWQRRTARWWSLELPLTLVMLGYIAGMSNTARLVALAVLVVTLSESYPRIAVRWWLYLGYFCILFSVAELIEIQRRDWNGDPIRQWQFGLVLLGYAATPMGAYIGPLFAPARWRWPALLLATVALWFTSANYDYDLAKGDAIYMAPERMWLVVVSMSYALVRALRIRQVRALWFFAVLNIALILYAELVTGKAQIDPNPRNFILVQVLFAVAAPLWVRRQWSEGRAAARASLALCASFVAFHMGALIAVHFESLRIAVTVEAAEVRHMHFDTSCNSHASRYSNIYLGRSMMLGAQRCEQEWVMAKDRPPQVAEFWSQIGPKWGFYRYTFGAKVALVGHMFEVPAFALEWVDLGRDRWPHRFTWGANPWPAQLRPYSVQEADEILRQMRQQRAEP